MQSPLAEKSTGERDVSVRIVFAFFLNIALGFLRLVLGSRMHTRHWSVDSVTTRTVLLQAEVLHALTQVIARSVGQDVAARSWARLSCSFIQVFVLEICKKLFILNLQSTSYFVSGRFKYRAFHNSKAHFNLPLSSPCLFLLVPGLTRSSSLSLSQIINLPSVAVLKPLFRSTTFCSPAPNAAGFLAAEKNEDADHKFISCPLFHTRNSL
jgi:hypothetical protein